MMDPQNYRPQTENDTNTKAKFASVQIRTFGRDTAIQANLLKNRHKIDTISIELTSVTLVSAKEKQGNWPEKIALMLDPDQELLQLIFFLSKRYVPPVAGVQELQFKYHGTKNNKSLKLIKNNDGSVLFSISHASKSYSIVVQSWFSIELLTLSYKAYAQRFGISVVDAVSITNVSQL